MLSLSHTSWNGELTTSQSSRLLSQQMEQVSPLQSSGPQCVHIPSPLPWCSLIRKSPPLGDRTWGLLWPPSAFWEPPDTTQQPQSLNHLKAAQRVCELPLRGVQGLTQLQTWSSDSTHPLSRRRH